jgi:SOS-response transcriptional repressor LexA
MPVFTIAPVQQGVADWARARSLPSLPLTQVQLKILKFIYWYQRMWGATPIYREIGAACGLGSESAVAYQVRRLRELGAVRKPSRLHRAILLDVIPVALA